MRRLILLPLGTLLTLASVAACSSNDSSSDSQPPAPAAQIKNDTPQQQNQDGSKSLPTAQNPVQQNPSQSPAGYFEATSGGQRILIPASSMIAIQFPVDVTSNPDKSINLPGLGTDAVSEEKLPQITVPVKDVQGAPVFAAGSKLIGTLKMSAPRAVFNVTGVKFGSVVYSMAAHADVTSTKVDRSNLSFTNILLGALAGSGIAVIIDGTGQDRSITWWAPLIGGAVGGTAAALLFKDTESIVQVKANETAVLVPGPM
ncbi:hypothetical protein EBU99_09680 [bacterium]|nr:hypothetical protein [bacterium]